MLTAYRDVKGSSKVIAVRCRWGFSVRSDTRADAHNDNFRGGGKGTGGTNVRQLQVAEAKWLARPTAVWEDPGSNLTTNACIYRDNRCDIQLWARAAHLYNSA